MSITQEIKDYVLSECRLDLVGIADVALLEDEAEGYRPTDILPGAKSVIVYGRRMPDGGVQSAFRHFEDGHPTARGSYSAYCADLAPNFNLFFNTFDISQFIEQRYDHTTTPLPCGAMQCGLPSSVSLPAFAEPFRVGLPLNIERAAYAAGLGDYGWSGRILTEKYGPRIQFGAVLTTLPLEYDAPYSGEKLCKGASCQACVKHCPTAALPAPDADAPLPRGVAGYERETADIRLNRCVVAACGLRREFGGFGDYVDTADPTEEELTEAFQKKPINHFEGLDHYPKWRCDKCLIYCPTGGWHEKFAKRGLTKKAADDFSDNEDK
jgi:epoxyqueuosine reductase QueG